MSGDHDKQDSLWREESDEAKGPVECLGMTFESDEARRAYFLEKLRAKLADPEFRKIEGFPIGEDEDILRLSDPPYYTACPNPFIEDFIRCYGRPYDPAHDDYHREPFAADVSEGKNDPIYNVHSYHTKVPHKAIMRYIAHYTAPGDIVLDGFCGTGMTAVAAAMCGAVGDVDQPSTGEVGKGQRWAIISDLSPIATFIASSLLQPFSRADFLAKLEELCLAVDRQFGHLYLTRHTGWKVTHRKKVAHKSYHHEYPREGSVDFTLYSDVVRCPECSSETTLYAVAVDEKRDCLRSSLRCPHCGSTVPESKWERVYSTEYDAVLGRTIEQVRLEPVLINYTVGSTRYEKLPDEDDRRKAHEALSLLASRGLPPVQLIDGRETQRNVPIGITHLHQFFTPREHLFMAELLRQIDQVADRDVRHMLLFALTATAPYASRMRRFRADRKGGGPLSGTLYVSSLVTPPNVLKAFRRRALAIVEGLVPPVAPARGYVVSTQDAGHLWNIPDCAVDYIFTDPPFGYNFDYSELNFFWEGLLGVSTNQGPEAIISTAQEKGINEYRELMEQCFAEYYRVLKPGRWVTVEFSSTKASVWNAIQVALEKSGLVVANVASLDKRQHSFKAVTTPTAVKQDLVISAYKPTTALENRFRVLGSTEESAWAFVRSHLAQLPIFVCRNDKAEVIAERTNHLLFDRMVAFHVQRGVTVPLSAAEFYAGLKQRFVERDGMYFLPEQAAEYDQKRAAVKEMVQLQLIITGEESAIQWLRLQLDGYPQTFQELQPQFMREIAGWGRHEKPLELSELLEQNFLCYDGSGPVPAQVHGYLSTKVEALRDLAADDPAMVAAARDRWYVPDPNKASDLEKLRERALLREFDDYRRGTERKLKVFRLEAVRAGFRRAWQEKDYRTIVEVARRIPESVLREDPKLLMWFNQAATRLGEV